MLSYHHVDVFAAEPYTGNSLAVFVDPPDLDARQMLAITRELRHFETIFIGRDGAARVFDLIEELDFAGHPVLGAAAVLHSLDGRAERTVELKAGSVRVETATNADGTIAALVDQGRPRFIKVLPPMAEIAAAVGLDDLALPPEIISTGLRYLIIPVRGGLDRAHIARPDFDGFLQGLGAQFAYILDVEAIEGRHWNNDGLLEDVATGSAAGCVGAFLLRHGLVPPGQEFSLAQGRFVGRPSRIAVTAYPDRVTVGGDVVLMGTGTLTRLP